MLPGPQPSIQVCLVPYLALFVSFFFQPMMAPRKQGRQLSPAVSASDFTDTSVASSPAPNSATETVSKKVKFNRRFKTDTTCDDDVLSGFGSAKVNILTRSSERQKEHGTRTSMTTSSPLQSLTRMERWHMFSFVRSTWPTSSHRRQVRHSMTIGYFQNPIHSGHPSSARRQHK
jgi:hypothetical protein